jgi:hypothetical protein
LAAWSTARWEEPVRPKAGRKTPPMATFSRVVVRAGSFRSTSVNNATAASAM